MIYMRLAKQTKHIIPSVELQLVLSHSSFVVDNEIPLRARQRRLSILYLHMIHNKNSQMKRVQFQYLACIYLTLLRALNNEAADQLDFSALVLKTKKGHEYNKAVSKANTWMLDTNLDTYLHKSLTSRLRIQEGEFNSSRIN